MSTRNINLYDPSLRLRRDPFGFDALLGSLAAAALLVVLAAVGAQLLLARSEPVASTLAAELQSGQSAMQAMAAQNAARRPDTALQGEIARLQRTLLQRRAALQSIDAGSTGSEAGFSTRLEALARQSVDGLWLTGLTLRPDDVLLKGRATNPALIPVYVQRLEKEPTLQGRSFKALEVNRPLDAPTEKSAPTDGASGVRAEFVEFTLTGPNSVPTLVADKGARP
jgi:hypothetical protein